MYPKRAVLSTILQYKARVAQKMPLSYLYTEAKQTWKENKEMKARRFPDRNILGRC